MLVKLVGFSQFSLQCHIKWEEVLLYNLLKNILMKMTPQLKYAFSKLSGKSILYEVVCFLSQFKLKCNWSVVKIG